MDDSDQIKDDVALARDTYKKMMVKGEEAVDRMFDLADAIEHPRAYEVLGNTIKTVTDIADKLVDLHKKNKDINKDEDITPKLEGPTTNNNLFLTTDEFQRKIQDAKESSEVVDVTPNESSKE